jgi:hypothetical protein
MDILEFKQCYAPTIGGNRCLREALEEKKHCVLHDEKSHRLYKRYKKICKVAKKIDIQHVNSIQGIQDKIMFLNKCYATFKSAYEGRMEHRMYAIHKSLHDYGHDAQFKIILTEMDICEDKLVELHSRNTERKIIHENKSEDKFENESGNAHENKVEIPDDSEDSKKNSSLIEKITQFKQQRREEQEETNRIIEQYIKENNEVLELKPSLIECISECLLPFAILGGNLLYIHMRCMLSVIGIFFMLKSTHSHSHRKLILLYTDMGSNASNIEEFLDEADAHTIAIIVDQISTFKSELHKILSDLLSVWDERNIIMDKTFLEVIVVNDNFRFKLRNDIRMVRKSIRR